MHFVTGGAFNGKRNWVMHHYGMELQNENLLLSPFKTRFTSSPSSLLSIEGVTSFKGITIIEGIEYFILELIGNGEGMRAEGVREHWNHILNKYLEWEAEGEDRQLILIGSDVTKGVVPLKKRERIWRDLVGWCYQDIVKMSKRVDLIWYGINQRLK